MSISRLVVATGIIFLVLTNMGTVSGQEYPSKPIRIITGEVGGGNDLRRVKSRGAFHGQAKRRPSSL